jgi:acyl-CoA reductase-like NAD-dependent aldehyde dehydrogenase
MAFDPAVPAVWHLTNRSIWDGKLFLNGWNMSENGTADVTDKSTGEVLAKIANANSADVNAASRSAVVAAKLWSRTPPEQRAAILRRAGQLLLQYEEEAVSLVSECFVKATRGELHRLAQIADRSRMVATLTKDKHSSIERYVHVELARTSSTPGCSR